jgi:hexosaminidase
VNLIPRPRQLTPREGGFTIDARTTIFASAEAKPIADLLRDQLGPAMGFRLIDALTAGADDGQPAPGHGAARGIRMTVDPTAGPGPESYRLEVSPTGIELVGRDAAGLFYASQTLRQLLPTAIFSEAQVVGVAWTVASVSVEDGPRFGWRGALLDVGRYFFPKAFVLRYIDLLALHKLNVLHLHLTEDQGWRLEIRKYPRLTELGAWRPETMIGHLASAKASGFHFDGTPHGGYYSQDDIREIVAYAASRFVTVVPEVELPGHSQAAIAAYPALGNVEEPLSVETTWGIKRHVLNVEDSTLDFYRDVYEEVLELFPSRFIHIGGDECPKDEWRASPAAQRRMRELGLANEDELQSWFIRQFDAFLAERGRQLVGWDEILEGGLASGATVMSWRGEAGGIAAARAGHDVVMVPDDVVYFDYYQSADRAAEPVADGGLVTLETVHGYDPIPAELTPAEARHVLGAQFALWTEYVPDPAHAEYMTFPRACAFAEVVWSPGPEIYAAFLARLESHLDRLRAMDVRFRPLDPPPG